MIKIKTVFAGLILALLFAGPVMAADALQPANTNDVVNNLGMFSDIGKFLLEYSIHIAVFIMVACAVWLSIRGSWARGNQKVDEAVHIRDNVKGLVIDGVFIMVALIILFNVVIPYIKGFVPGA